MLAKTRQVPLTAEVLRNLHSEIFSTLHTKSGGKSALTSADHLLPALKTDT